MYVEAGCPLAHALRKRCGNVTVVQSAGDATESSGELDFSSGARIPKNSRVLRRGMLRVANLRRVSIPAGIEKIERGCFAESALEEVRLAPTVREVCADAFCSCLNLREAVLGQGLRTIGDFAFASCALEAAEIPGSARVLGVGAFSRCSSLCWVKLGSGLREIGACCFEGAGLRRVEVPAGVRAIGERAFYGCRGLCTVVVPAKSELRRVGAHAFGATGVERANVQFPRGAEVDARAFSVL